MNRSWLTALLLVSSPAPLLAFGGVAVFEGPPGGVGSVSVYDEASGLRIGAPAELAGVRLLSIDFSGRTRLEEFLPGRPRLRLDVAGAGRLALPNGRGSLYRFERANEDGTATFGFLHVGRDGTSRSVLERAGIGASGQDDPFVARVAVAPAGDAFLVATRAPAGGDLLEVALGDATAVVDRTAGLPPLRFSGAGLALTAARGIGASTRGVYQFARAGAGDATAISFAPDHPTTYTGELVLSRNGAWAATTAGSASDQLHVYAFDAQGTVRRATSAPAKVSGAGFLPEAQDGPYLAVDDLGLHCAWRVELPAKVAGEVTREAFVARTEPQAGEAPEQLTADANFSDTLDEVGLFLFKLPGKLVMAVGEQNTPGENAIGRSDFFEATVPSAGGPAVLDNLSLSSGDATVPFLAPPTLEPGLLALLPDSSGIVVHDDGGNNAPIYLVRPGQSGMSVLLPAIKSLDAIEVAGRHMMFSVGRPNDPKPQELWRWSWSAAGTPALVATEPEGTQFVRTAPRRDGWVGFVTRAPLGAGEWLDRAHLGTGALEELEPNSSLFGPAVGVSALGSFVFSRGAPGQAATYWTWPFQGFAPVAMQAPAGPGQVLPGM